MWGIGIAKYYNLLTFQNLAFCVLVQNKAPGGCYAHVMSEFEVEAVKIFK